MADKPRLKKSDEILGSIAVEPSRAAKQPGGVSPRKPASGRQERRERPERESRQPDFDFDGEDVELNDQPSLPSAQSLAEKLMARDNRKQLNFSKYELPKRDSASAPASVTIPARPRAAEPDPAPVTTPSPARAAEPLQAPEPAPVSFEQPSTATSVVTEYTFQSFETQTDKPSVVEFQAADDDSALSEPRSSSRERSRRRFLQQTSDTVGQDSTLDLDSLPQFDFDPSEDSRDKAYQETQAKPRIQTRPEPEATPAPAPEPEPEPKLAAEDPLAVEERNRQEFLNRIASQFELQFEEKFEEGKLPGREVSAGAHSVPGGQPAFVPREGPPSERRRPEPEPVFAPPREEPRRPSIAEEEAPASDFIAKFQEDIRNEEHQRSEDFKETLAEKFERERQRYLKELDLNVDEPPEQQDAEESAPQPRRRLDFQIQPEMHVQGGETARVPHTPTAATGPVTYTRGGAAKPLAPAEVGETPAVASTTARKTAEQLLMEHSVRAKVPAAPKVSPAKLKFTFSTPDEQAKSQKKEKDPILPTEKWPRRIMLTAMAAGLFAIGLLLWPLIRYIQLSDSLVKATDAASLANLPPYEDVLNVYNDLNYTQTAKVNSVMFKNADVTLKNVDVNDYVVIEGIDSKGKIRLEDVNVDTAISVKSCGIDTLELHNVKAGRIIINNATSDMTISATGKTDVDVVELRTPATVGQSELPADASGVRSMVITPAESGGSINAKLNGLSLLTLDISASDSVIAFENSVRAETMSSDGSLSLTGNGKVVNLAVGAKSGLGAGDIDDQKPVTLFVNGVTVTNLNVKSPANLNLSTTVDNVSTSDAVLIGGEGNIGAFTLNPKAGSTGRLLIDIAGLNVQSLYSNVKSRINITGSARVNTLTADESTYILGNKVNHLKANADGVIYENEPDKTTTADGVRPPQSKAENPNLDYNLGDSGSVVDTTGGDFATTCGHSRESGGFLLGDGSKDSPYEVSSPAQLAHAGAHLESYFIQTADIDISTDSSFSGGFPMIGSASTPFAGVYDGRGFDITKLRIISSGESIGLFASNKGIIQNVRLVSGEVGGNDASKLSFVGGIVGINAEGGSVRSCSNGAAVNGGENAYTGGIAGYNFGAKIHDCYNYAKVSGADIVGGLVGYNRNSATLTGSYNAGSVQGGDESGGVAGKNEDAIIANCYYLMDSADFGIGNGDGTATEKSSSELQSTQMAADLAAGNESSLWVSGSASSGGYRYPVHRKPSPAP